MLMPDAAAILGVPVHRESLDQLTEQAVAAVQRRHPPIVFACANPHSIVTAQGDRDFMQALRSADAVVAAGGGVTMISALAGAPGGARDTRTDKLRTVLRALDSAGGARVFFFGSTPQVLSLITARLALDYPSMVLAGTYSPPYGAWSSDDNDAMIERINRAKPDVLWVGMTAPKQEKWVARHRGRLDARLIGSIGAVFDFYAGTVPRAPAWMCRSGTEWVYRLLREPRRLWRRNVVSGPRFVGLVVASRLRAGRTRKAP